MKKITLLLAAFLISAVAISQTVIIDRLADGGNSIISVDGTDGNQVFCADHFTLASETILGEIDLLGTNSNSDALGALLSGFSIYIYTDVGSLPSGDPTMAATGVVELPSIDISAVTVITDGGFIGEFTVSFTAANGGTQIVLPAGDYWIAVGAVVDDSLGAGRWNWQLSATVAGVEPVLIDPADLFGVGATSWSNIGALIGATASSMAWQLRDEAPLSVEDNNLAGVSVYPNPTIDVLNVTVPFGADITSAKLFDMLGRDTGITLNDGVFNTASLAKGMYMVSLETTEGNYTTKIVKQ